MRSTSNLSLTEDRMNIKTLEEEGYTPLQISRKLKVGRQMVYKWLDRKTLVDKKRSGRPTVLSPIIKMCLRASHTKKVVVLCESLKVPQIGKISFEEKQKNIKDNCSGFHRIYTIMDDSIQEMTKATQEKKIIGDRVKFGEILTKDEDLTPDAKNQRKRANIFFFGRNLD